MKTTYNIIKSDSSTGYALQAEYGTIYPIYTEVDGLTGGTDYYVDLPGFGGDHGVRGSSVQDILDYLFEVVKITNTNRIAGLYVTPSEVRNAKRQSENYLMFDDTRDENGNFTGGLRLTRTGKVYKIEQLSNIEGREDKAITVPVDEFNKLELAIFDEYEHDFRAKLQAKCLYYINQTECE